MKSTFDFLCFNFKTQNIGSINEVFQKVAIDFLYYQKNISFEDEQGFTVSQDDLRKWMSTNLIPSSITFKNDLMDEDLRDDRLKS